MSVTCAASAGSGKPRRRGCAGWRGSATMPGDGWAGYGHRPARLLVVVVVVLVVGLVVLTLAFSSA